MREIKYLVIHTTASPQTWTWQKLQWYFLKMLGWKREGYHITIEPDGTVKRFIDNDKISNGVLPFKGDDINISNNNSVNVSYIGGIDSKGNGVNNITPEQTKALVSIIRWYVKEYPDIKILGHNQVANKFCPCFSVPKLLKTMSLPKQNIYETDNFNVLKWNKL
jgi:N-acetylmuramoyl-L-alanine amidase